MPTKKNARRGRASRAAKIDQDIRIRKEQQANEHNRIIKVMLVLIGAVALFVVAFLVVSSLMSSFTYQGVKFKIVKFCDSGPPCLVTYQTSLPVQYQGKIVPYNFYLRNDPRKLNVSFNGTIYFKNNMLVKFEDGFVCQGKGAIAAANLAQLYNLIGVNVTSDDNATCSPYNQYMFLDVKPGNMTAIEQTAPECYTITIKDCEILNGLEKFMIQTFVETNELLKNQSASKP